MTEAPIERDDEGALAKLRRRKVGQWGIAYAAGAWALLQVVGFFADTFHWPELAKQLTAIALVVGSPIVLVVAWYHGDRGEQRVTRVEMAILTLLCLLGGGALWLYGQRNAPLTDASAPQAAATAAQVSPITSVDDRPSIAVLPFENRSRLDDDVIFVDGIHDDILTQLSKVSALKVISRTSVERFRKTELPIKEIARQLGVKAILEGGVQRGGDRVRINVQLIEAASDAHLWAETYDRELTAANVFAIQSEVAAAIAGALKAALSADEKARVNAMPTQSLEAWENYQLGNNRLAKRTSVGFDEAERYFRKAIELDPKFALAYSGLADSLALRVDYSDVPRAATLERARAAVGAALKLDAGLADAWASAGLIEFYSGHGERAEEMYRRAITINPNHVMVRKWYGTLLLTLNRIEEGVAQLEWAARLDPLSATVQENLGVNLEALGRYDEAAFHYRKAIEIDPSMPSPYQVLAVLAATVMNKYDLAIPLLEKSIALDTDSPYPALVLARLLRTLGDDPSADRVLREARERWPDTAGVYAELAFGDMVDGDRNAAQRNAERALKADARNGAAVWILGVVDYREGRYAESVARYRTAFPQLFLPVPAVDWSNYSLAISVVPALRKLGETDQADALLASSEAVRARLPPLGGGVAWGGRVVDDARALALRGRKQEALTALRAAERAGWREWWRFARDVDPLLDSVREDPEFKAIFADIERDMARQRAQLARRPKGAPLDLAIGS